MSDCCNSVACEIDKIRDTQSSTLKIVLAINLVMFVAEFGAGVLASSTALMADSLDMLGDAMVYIFSLYVILKSDAWKAGAAFFKSGLMAFFGVFVLGQAVFKFLEPSVPHYDIMGGMGLLALIANSICLTLLWRHRGEDVNMRSVWLCSRNDIIANTSVLIAAYMVFVMESQWPDLIVGVGIACLFLHSAYSVFQDASRSLSTASLV